MILHSFRLAFASRVSLTRDVFKFVIFTLGILFVSPETATPESLRLFTLTFSVQIAFCSVVIWLPVEMAGIWVFASANCIFDLRWLMSLVGNGFDADDWIRRKLFGIAFCLLACCLILCSDLSKEDTKLDSHWKIELIQLTYGQPKRFLHSIQWWWYMESRRPLRIKSFYWNDRVSLSKWNRFLSSCHSRRHLMKSKSRYKNGPSQEHFIWTHPILRIM